MPNDFVPSNELPNGFDRADGFDGRPGTQTDPANRILNGSPWNIENGGNGQRLFEEFPDSPSIERGEQGTVVHRFKCDQATGMEKVALYGRGTNFVDDQGNTTRVLTSRYDNAKGNLGVLTITSESTSFDITPPEFNCDVVELNPSLTKHPRYACLPRQVLWNVLQQYTAINPIQAQAWTNQLWAGVTPTVTPTQTQKDAVAELTAKLRKGFTDFYLAGVKVNFSTYSYYPQQMNFGGYVETPWAALDNSLPPQFYLDENGDNIFTEMMSTIAPMFYRNGIVWLRLADSQSRQRTWFRRTQSWVGSPAGGTILINGSSFAWRGIWDEDIYQRTFTAYNTNAYQ